MIEDMWSPTMRRVHDLPEPLLHQRVDDEWSFLETLRHLVREQRMEIVRGLVSGLTDDDLQRAVGEHTMQRCLLTLFDEEWHHHWYATRDLEVLLRETS